MPSELHRGGPASQEKQPERIAGFAGGASSAISKLDRVSPEPPRDAQTVLDLPPGWTIEPPGRGPVLVVWPDGSTERRGLHSLRGLTRKDASGARVRPAWFVYTERLPRHSIAERQNTLKALRLVGAVVRVDEVDDDPAAEHKRAAELVRLGVRSLNRERDEAAAAYRDWCQAELAKLEPVTVSPFSIPLDVGNTRPVVVAGPYGKDAAGPADASSLSPRGGRCSRLVAWLRRLPSLELGEVFFYLGLFAFVALLVWNEPPREDPLRGLIEQPQGRSSSRPGPTADDPDSRGNSLEETAPSSSR